MKGKELVSATQDLSGNRITSPSPRRGGSWNKVGLCYPASYSEATKTSVSCYFTGELFELFSLWPAKKLQAEKKHAKLYFKAIM